MQSREQQFAKDIYEQVNASVQYPHDSEERKKYGSMAHKLPILVRTAGLVQAWLSSTVEARHHTRICSDI